MSEQWQHHPVMESWLTSCRAAGYCTPDDVELLRSRLELPKYQMHDLLTDAILPQFEAQGIRYRNRRLKSGAYPPPAVRDLPPLTAPFVPPSVVRRTSDVNRGDRPAAHAPQPQLVHAASGGNVARRRLPAGPTLVLIAAVIIAVTALAGGFGGGKSQDSSSPVPAATAPTTVDPPSSDAPQTSPSENDPSSNGSIGSGGSTSNEGGSSGSDSGGTSDKQAVIAELRDATDAAREAPGFDPSEASSQKLWWAAVTMVGEKYGVSPNQMVPIIKESGIEVPQ